MKDQPFTFFWVASDSDPEHFRTRLRMAGVDWPCLFLPCGISSPTPIQWRINEWPTIFLLDHKGTIRYVGNEEALDPVTLEGAVETLLAEMAKERG